MKEKFILRLAAWCLVFSCTAGLSMAQDEPDDLFTLGEIVVEGSAGGPDISISNTVTAEEIQAIGAADAAEALQYVPGIYVQRTAKGELNINMQGFGQKNVLILIDGVPYYETKNGPLDLQQIPSSIIGRIEVTKGGSSVLYGPNALGGVVNIITKKGVKGASGVASAEGGSGGYGRGNATLNYGTENGFSVLGTVDYRTRDNLYFSDDYKPRATDIKYKGRSDGRSIPRVVDDGDKKDNSDLESLNLWTRLGFAPSDELEMYLSLYHFDMERGRPFSDAHNMVFNFDDGFSSFGRYDEYKDTGTDFGGRVSVNEQWDIRAMAFYHSHEDDYSSYLSEDLVEDIATSTWDDDSWGISLFSDTDFDRFGLLSFSVQYREDKHKQRDEVGYDWEKSESNTLTLAAEDTIQIGRFTAVLGMGYHNFDAEKIGDKKGYTDNTVDPMAGLTWKGQNGLEIFGSVAKKTRFPTFNDMEEDNVVYPVKPEENINYTLGAKYTFFNRAHVGISGFFNDINDRIETITIFKDTVDEVDIQTNIDEAEIYGFELETNTEITRRLSLGLDWVYTHARNTSADRESMYLEDVPEYTLSAELRYMIPKIETNFIIRETYKDSVVFDTEDEEKEDSTVVDLSLIKKWETGFSLGCHIYNLFDTDYYEGKGMACNGFNSRIVARYEF